MTRFLKGIAATATLAVVVAAVLFPVVMAAAPWADARTRTLMRTSTRDYMRRKAAGDAPRQLYTGVIVEFEGDEGLAQLVSDGAIVYHHRGEMALAYLPVDRASAIVAGNGHIRAMSASTPARLTVDVSRRLTGVDAVHAGSQPGNGLIQMGYDGSGVVAGLCDVGFDPQHIAFRNRVGQMTVYVDSVAERRFFDRADMATATADTREESHASHVANILAGGRESNPYYGGAPGAELVVSTSTELSDVSLLNGIEDIIAYARTAGKPAVVNLSVSSHLGPHDGSDLVNAYLDLLGEEAIICFSAGNSGHRLYSLHHVFGEDSPGHDGELYTVGSMMESSLTWNGFDVSGAIDLWGADATPFEVQFVAWDQIEKRFIYESRWYGGEDDFEVTSADGGEFDLWMHGTTIAGACGTNARNGRYNVYFEYDVRTEAELTPNHWARYICGWRVRAHAGTDLRGYTEGWSSYMRCYGVPGMVDGSTDLTANNLCANRNTICVGSWNGRNRVPDWGEGERELDFATGCATPWSSYEELIDGRTLPHFCAPGNTVVSAMNMEYLEAHPDERTACRLTVEGREYAWFEQCGTSMSSPMAAAVMALWCEAYPDLDVSTARVIAQQTAYRGYDDIADPRWGAGALDALAGLRKVIEIAGADRSVAANYLVEVRGKCIYVAMPEGDCREVSAYSVDGRRVPLETPLATGCYIVTVGADATRLIVRD